MKSAAAKPTLAPRLRFPEFRDVPGWEEKSIGQVVTPAVREKAKPSHPYTGLGIRNHGKGTFLKEFENPEKNSMDVLFEVKPDDLILNITFAWEGSIAIAKECDDGALVSHRFPTYTINSNESIPGFLRHNIVNKQFVYKLGVISPGGAGRNRVLNKNDFLKLPIVLPEIEEQHKIASCLSSLDDLIAAESQKLEALKAHKKGLMQHLFPREGETRPRLRFPEFQDTGEWELKRLGEFAEVAASGDLDSEHFSPSKTKKYCYPVYSNAVENEGIYGYYAVPKYPANCVTITARGTLGVAFLRRSKFMGIGRLLVLTFNQGIDSRFMKDCWNHLAKIPQEVTSIPQLTAVTARVTVFPIPSPKEQQRIASCLSSLDDLIAAQSDKLEVLKTHKKGLIQQLFPAAAEAGA